MATKNINKTYSEFIYKRTYSRWMEKENRRETWDETVDRYYGFFADTAYDASLPSSNNVEPTLFTEYVNAIKAVRNKEVMPSMRCLWTAGEALERENVAGYNCAYTVIDSTHSFAEILYILMNGTGVGFSTERQYINKLPEVPQYPNQENRVLPLIIFEDSKLGWAEGFDELIFYLYQGVLPGYELSKIRPKGSRLRTFGGRASGPEPLKELLDFTIATFKEAQGRKLNSIECYDLVCKIANCVVVGGVRRSATINLSNLTDMRMRRAKEGEFWIQHPQRTLSNNSVAYTEKPDMVAFMEEWTSLMKSGTGERGIVNRDALRKASERRDLSEYDPGVNPCGEIVLRPKQFCNLTEVVIRPEDTLEDLCNKVKYATILGCLQSTLTDFGFLSAEWKKNCEEERLLGVSLTGLMDHPVLQNTYTTRKDHFVWYPSSWLKIMKETAVNTAKVWSEALGISMPKAITCVKPSGTVSQLVDSSSGLHPRYSPYYIRRVRVTYTDPICKFLMAKAVPCNPEVGQDWGNVNTVVFDFPVKAPEGSIFRNDRTAIEQLEYWKMLKQFWCEHNPSCTIYVKEHEWLEVGAWVYRYWGSIGGLSFLPYDGGSYQLAPYEEITKEQYEKLVAEFPTDLNFEGLTRYEKGDSTSGAQEYACTGGSCELV